MKQIIILNLVLINFNIIKIEAQYSKIIGETINGEQFEIDSIKEHDFNLYYLDENGKKEFIAKTIYGKVYSIYYTQNLSLIKRKELAILFNANPTPIYFTAIRQLEIPYRHSPFKLSNGKWVVLKLEGIIDEITSQSTNKVIDHFTWKTREMFEISFQSYFINGSNKQTNPITYFLNDGEMWKYPLCDSTRILHGASKDNLIIKTFTN